jgi:hypothetical protein
MRSSRKLKVEGVSQSARKVSWNGHRKSEKIEAAWDDKARIMEFALVQEERIASDMYCYTDRQDRQRVARRDRERTASE